MESAGYSDRNTSIGMTERIADGMCAAAQSLEREGAQMDRTVPVGKKPHQRRPMGSPSNDADFAGVDIASRDFTTVTSARLRRHPPSFWPISGAAAWNRECASVVGRPRGPCTSGESAIGRCSPASR